MSESRNGQWTIASHCSELIEELRGLHRDHNYKIVRVRDDLASALRYAWMARDHGLGWQQCRGVGYGRQEMPYAGHVPDEQERQESRFARGTPNHPGGSFDVFTGR